MTAQRSELIAYLTGTAHSMTEGLAACGIEMDESEAESAVVDEIFLCATCGWWCEIDEANEGDDGDVCNDCAE